MDYLIVLFLSLLSPVALHLSDIDYITETGITFSDPVHLGSQSVHSIDTGDDKTGSYVVSTNYFGNYGITYEISFDYKFYLDKKNWLALKTSYAPLREGAEVVIKPDQSVNTVPLAFLYTERPTFGVLIGHDFKYVSPYIGASFARIAYAGYGNFEIEEQFDSTLIYSAGLRYKFDSNWSGVAEVAGYKIDMRYIVGQSYDVKMRTFKYRFGVLYSFNKPKDIINNNKNVEYQDIIKSLDPTINERIEKQEEEKLAKSKKKTKATSKASKTSQKPAETKLKETSKASKTEVKQPIIASPSKTPAQDSLSDSPPDDNVLF